MRKRYKDKRRSCALCKPHKRGWSLRWSVREQDRLRRFERERREWQGKPNRGEAQ